MRHPANIRRQRFVEEYLVDLNAKEAAIRAGYSPKTAKQIGHKLRKDPVIDAAIVAAQAKRSKKTGIVAEDVVEEIRKIAFATNEKATDKLRALELLAKHINVRDLFPQRMEVTGKDGGPILGGAPMFQIVFESPKEKA
jgi:phage terminase small subunit